MERHDPQTISTADLHVDVDLAPSLQLSFNEISAAELDRLLGYAGICSANAPIGLDADFTPHTVGPDADTQFLLFPLAGLEAHLITEEPKVAESLQASGSMDAFVRERGDSMSAVVYLTAALLSCIQFCRMNKQALLITW